MRVETALLAAAVSIGCGAAGGDVRPGGVSPTQERRVTWSAWQDLVQGRTAAALSGFERALGEDRDDLVASFGRATVDYGRARSTQALDAYLTLLERVGAGHPDPWGPALSTVAAARLGTLFAEIADRRAAENRLLAIRRDGLPWQARVELALVADGLARSRGEPLLLRRLAREAGCAEAVHHLGVVGSLPHVDLAASGPPRGPGPEAWASGCRLNVPAQDGLPGAQVVEVAYDVRAGEYDLVLDFAGQARVSVDGGEGRSHGSAFRFGPRRSASRLRLAAGKHRVEVRLAIGGGTAEAHLLLMPARPSDAASGAVPSGGQRGAAEEVLADVCLAYQAGTTGDADVALAAASRLSRLTSFGAGLAVAAWLEARDPTRPAHLARDRARPLLRAAVAADPALARAWHDLAVAELADGRPREAIDHAEKAGRAQGWWRPDLTLWDAFRERGLDRDADRALDRALEAAPNACGVLETGLRRAGEQRRAAEERRLADRLAERCIDSDSLLSWLRARGLAERAASLVGAQIDLDPSRTAALVDLGSISLARGDASSAAASLRRALSRTPWDPGPSIKLADALLAAGDTGGARQTLEQALQRRPDAQDLRRAARALGLPLPLDAFRIDGSEVIRAFEASGRRFDAPAVVVLDRTVLRAFADGATLILTHNIVRVQSKEAIDRFGEVDVPEAAEVLALRTHKADGSTREPEEIAGKTAISAPDLALGDYVEWETLESRPRSDAFPSGFLGDRFYFQSFEAPLDRSEYVVVTPPSMAVAVDRRGAAPEEQIASGPEGVVVRTFVARQKEQVHAERATVPPAEWLPSARVSSGITFSRWTRFLREQLHGGLRSSPHLRARAAALGQGAAGPRETAERIVRWTTRSIEPGSDLRDPASHAIERGQGSRLGVALALARELGVPARPVLVRSRLAAGSAGPPQPGELDAFEDILVRFDVGGRPVMADLRVRHAPFGYLHPTLRGAVTLEIADGAFGVAEGEGEDRRTVQLDIRLDEQGGAEATVQETLVGWPAIEWAEVMESLGGDRVRLRQHFEQQGLGREFPGASLGDLSVEIGRQSTRLRYSFKSSQLAVRGDRVLRASPVFFRSQPGRRYATEAARRTPLQIGPDIDLDLTARIVLPPGARMSGPEQPARKLSWRGLHFVEERRQGRSDAAGRSRVIVIRRQARLPVLRVSPAEYAGGVAAMLRAVDQMEQAELTVELP